MSTDADGNVDMDALKAKMNSGLAYVLNILKYLTMIALYGGMATVVYGVYTMEAPKDIWGDNTPHVSPAVNATVNLTIQFFVMYFFSSVFFLMVCLSWLYPATLVTKCLVNSFFFVGRVFCLCGVSFGCQF